METSPIITTDPNLALSLDANVLMEGRDIRKIYETPAGGVEALRGVNIKIYPGEFIAVVGKSGAGKSTLVNVLACIDAMTQAGDPPLFRRTKDPLEGEKSGSRLSVFSAASNVELN